MVTIGRAELAVITSAILCGHSHIATDTLLSLHQIRKHLLYLELHSHHAQGDILKLLIQIVRNSPNPVHLFEVESHAGIVGNECADSVAKYQATQVDTSHAETGMPCAGIGGNPFHDLTWLVSERDTPLNAKNTKIFKPAYHKAPVLFKSACLDASLCRWDDKTLCTLTWW